MGELTAIGFVPGCSTLHRIDARTKQALLMGLSVMSLWGHLIFLTLLTIITLHGLRSAGVRLWRLIREIRYFLVLLGLVFALRALNFTDINGWLPAVTADSAASALIVCWRLLLVVCMGLLLMATTRSAEIRASLVWFLRPIPALDEKMAATMVGLVVRLIPVILLQAGEIGDAQRARCIERCKNPLTRIMRFTIPLFRRVFLGADELAMAMQARCYSEHRSLPDLSFTWRDGLVLGSAMLLFPTLFLP